MEWRERNKSLDEIFNSFGEVKNYMVKDIIKYNNKKFLLSTVLIDNCVFETMVFPIINGQVSGSEVYTFRTVESGKSLNKHKDIYEHPEKYVSNEVIEQYLTSKEDW